MDLRDAIHCIEKQKANRTYRGARIGFVRKKIPCLCPYLAGEVVLFTPDERGTVTVELPFPADCLQRQEEAGSLLTTGNTVVSVEPGYVEEIIW